MKKYILITGATDGIGLKSAEKFASMGKRLILHGRRKERLSAAIERIRAINPQVDLKGVVADFEDLSATQEVFSSLKGVALECLVNNAGTFDSSGRLTKDGFEVTYQVNHLAHVLITHLLLDSLKKTEWARIVIVASMAHAHAVDFNALELKRFPVGYEAYALSKLCNILFAFKMARMLKKERISVNCIHPGVINTKLLVNNWGACGVDVNKAHEMVLFACNLDKSVTGKYLKDFRVAKAADIAYEETVQDRCYEISLKHLKEVGIKL